MINEIWLAGGTRTPIGGFLGTLAEVPAPALGSVAIKESLRRAGVAADQVDEVILGNVVGAGLGQNVARQAAIGAGLPASVGATTVNKVCGSGMKAVMLAAQAIQCGDAQAVVAGGTENMSAAPYLLPKARTGYRLGHGELLDAVIKDGLWDVYNNLHMGTFGDRCAAKEGISRQEQDDFAVASYQRAMQGPEGKSLRRGNGRRGDQGPQGFGLRQRRRGRRAASTKRSCGPCGRPSTPPAASRPAMRRASTTPPPPSS